MEHSKGNEGNEEHKIGPDNINNKEGVNECSQESAPVTQQPDNAADREKHEPSEKLASGMSPQNEVNEEECSTADKSKKKKRRSRKKKKKSVSAQDKNETTDKATSADTNDSNLLSTGDLTSGKEGENNVEETLERKSPTSPERPSNGDDDDLAGGEIQGGDKSSSEVEVSVGVAADEFPQPAIGKQGGKGKSDGLANQTQDTMTDEEEPSGKQDGNAVIMSSVINIHKESDKNSKLCGLTNDTETVDERKEDLCMSEEDDRSCSSERGPENADKHTADTPVVALCTQPKVEEDLESDAEYHLFSTLDCEGRNILCIFKLIYGVGLRALRKLFMEINPSWRNQPSDAAAFDRGTMKLNKEEDSVFNSGDINKWDFSLITTALIFSKTGALEISKRPGYGVALKELKKIRNKLLGHPCTDGMCDDDFKSFWRQLCDHFETLGADPDEIAEIKFQSDVDLHAGGYYKSLFMDEKTKYFYHDKRLDSIEKKVDALYDALACSSCKTPVSLNDLSGPNWDAWLRFCDAVREFDTRKNQYILVTDALSQENLHCFSILRSVPWKMVLDFDPMSEEKGFYYEFTSHEGQGNLVSMITPTEMKPKSMVTLVREIDSSKIQWLFVNGRSSDMAGKEQEFAEWEATSVKEMSRFFGCCCDPDKFDKQKPVVCLILPFCKKTVPYLERTLSRFFENFVDQFRLEVVSFKQEKQLSAFGQVKIRIIDLAPDLVHLGLKQLLCLSSSQQYLMPSSQANVYAELSEKEFLYLNENLEILYDGCEELPVPNNPSEEDVNLQKFLEEHRRLFISGNPISFPSLYDNHDARRGIENDIRNHVQRLLDKRLTRSMIVEIKHLPGTGGTTIARRVMWDLHKDYPCAFIEINSHLYHDEDNNYARKLADRIAALEEICHTSPVILIDGKQSRAIEGLSNKLVRLLCNFGKRALLLRCLHGSKTAPKEPQETSRVHKVFYVDVKLEDSYADLNEFHKMYKEFIEKSLGEGGKSGPACRVFHFPLLAMLQTFRPKLKKIIDDSWDEMESLQQDIAVVVAFLQKYANQPTPALLLYDAFKRYIHLGEQKNVTYEDIKQLFTEHLLNLMVPSNPLIRRGRDYRVQESSPESYTFQHRVVAEMLLKKAFQTQGCDLFRVVNQFLQFPVFQREDFMPLLEELFVHNKDGEKKRKFSVLFEELKSTNQERTAEIFCDAAEKTGNSVIFSNAARFFAKMDPPAFRRAMELIERAFQAKNAKQKFRRLFCTKGNVLYFELTYMANTGRVKTLARLEELASKVLEAYKEARTFPPTYPNPLIGEVDVWLACISWIMKNICGRDSEKTLKFLANQCPPFFRTCVSDSFYLLDIVDGIVQSVPTLSDPEETQRKCYDARLSLMKTFRTGPPSNGRGRDAEDVVQACKALCSAKNFPRSSALELKRLQALFLFNSVDAIDNLKQEHLQFLQKLLGDLVFQDKEYRFAYHLMKVCVLVTGAKSYSLEQGFVVTEKWLEVSRHDSLPYFYQMAICFLKILDGNAIEFMPKYLKALTSCREKSQNHCRSTQSTLFVSKDGKGMSRLVTRNTLFRGETDYSTDVHSDRVTRFWQVDIRKKLLECKGRIRVEPSSDRDKKLKTYIELIQGQVELYVAKNAGIGKVERDFTKGQLAYFVISFNLQGPVANGITFEPKNPSSH